MMIPTQTFKINGGVEIQGCEARIRSRLRILDIFSKRHGRESKAKSELNQDKPLLKANDLNDNKL